MKQYSEKIALVRNGRGVYCLDTSIGCASGLRENTKGCYGDCYAAKSAKMYGYDFGTTVLRRFESRVHQREIIGQINRAKLDFIRIGCSGDPSENWEHCVGILKVIANCNKEIVIITKHWTNLTDKHLAFFNTLNLCVNTSVSAIDKPELLKNSMEQYHRLKPFCRSILRIVSADFNLENETGRRLSELQDELLKNGHPIDTVLRVGKNNPLVSDGIINIKRGSFLGTKQWLSKRLKKTYLGKCANCKEMCGINIAHEGYRDKRLLSKQLELFKSVK